MRHRVPVAPFRDAYLRSGWTPTEVCEWLGYRRRDGKADTRRLRRILGLDAEGKTTVNYDNAVKLCLALGLDPWEAGI